MNGFSFVADTNVIFMALYNLNSKAGKILLAAIEGKIKLFSTDTVKEEIRRLLTRKLFVEEKDTEAIIDALPITWIEKEAYTDFIDKTRVKHKEDKPLEVLAIAMNCKIITADKKFGMQSKRVVDVNKLLEEIGKL